MATCLSCKLQYPNSALYCPSCASPRESRAQHSYRGSILFGVGLFALIVIWKVATLTPTSGEDAIQIAPQPPDEAAVLIPSCGTPDEDRITPDKEVQQSSRIL